MIIGIDARFYGEAGPGRYVKNLLLELEKIDDENRYVVFLKKAGFAGYSSNNSRFRKVLADYPWYSLSEQILLPLKIWSAKVDLMHFTQFNIPVFWLGNFVVTIHDMIMHEFSTERQTTRSRISHWLKKSVFLFVFNTACLRAKKILVPSAATKGDLIHKIGLRPEKIIITYEGIDTSFKEAAEKSSETDLTDQKVLLKYRVKKPYVLYVGSMYPHKNLERLVTAFGILSKRYAFPGQLVLVGKESYFSKRLRKFITEHGLSERITFPATAADSGYLSDTEAVSFFRQAAVYVFPSLKEGFGLSPLEAMALGIPTAVSQISAMPEICGDAALFFDPCCPEDIAEKLNRLLSDEALRSKLVGAGYTRVKFFSWTKMAELTLAAYRLV